MRPLRALFGSFAIFMAGLALAQQVNIDLWSCGSCSLVKDTRFAPWLAYGGVPALVVLAVLGWNDSRWFRVAAPLAGLTSVGLSAWMLRTTLICEVCLLTHVAVVALALTAVRAKAATGAAVALFVLGVGSVGSGALDPVLEAHARRTPLQYRVYEQAIPAGDKVVVLFSDPECTRCKREDLAVLLNPPSGVRVLHRWFLLPHSRYRTLRAAAAVEAVARSGPDREHAFRVLLARETRPLTDRVLTTLADTAGVGALVRGALAEAHPATLDAISMDEAAGTALKFTSLPAVAVAEPPLQDGTRFLVPGSLADLGR